MDQLADESDDGTFSLDRASFQIVMIISALLPQIAVIQAQKQTAIFSAGFDDCSAAWGALKAWARFVCVAPVVHT